MSYPLFLQRSAMLMGEEGIAKLSLSTVALVGLGGVGGGALEGLVRAGVGHLHLVDDDVFSISNLNRQILSDRGNMGKDKVEVAKERALSINPDIDIHIHKTFVLPEVELPFGEFDFLIDAIDTLKAKIFLAEKCKEFGIGEVACLGMGNRFDPSLIRCGDLYQTQGDPLAKAMRRACRKRGIDSLRVIYSLEEPTSPLFKVESSSTTRRDVPGSLPFVPPVAGYLASYEAIRFLLSE